MSQDRRFVLKAGALGVVSLLAQGCAAPAASTPSGPATPLGFTGLAPTLEDRLVVPPEYEAQVLFRWGDPIGHTSGAPAFLPDGGNTAADQALQAGMHHDGMHFFELPGTSGARALLAINHEYTDEALLHTDGVKAWTAEKVRKSQHAVGVSIIEVALTPRGWQQVLPSRFARRIHAATPMKISGPATGHALMQTAANTGGDEVLGTFANCAMGATPWGTYLTCEENVQGYFGGVAAPGSTPDAKQQRYGNVPGGNWVDWFRFDERFDVTKHPNEAHRHGWVVEIDPMDPTSTPIKRTALGRKRQESATCTLTREGRVAVYMGDDGRFEYIYKFVSRDVVKPGGYAANFSILDHGTLYVARFDGNGQGQWIDLVHSKNGLNAAAGFGSQAEVVVKARMAADLVGATKMDRPEWIAVHPQTGEVFVALTNNTQRGEPGRPGVDPANPRARNSGGHILQWREGGNNAASNVFRWKQFVLAGDPTLPGSDTAYPPGRADAFGAPDGLYFDPSGLLWIQTDMNAQAVGKGAYANLGNNAMLCADLSTGNVKRFLTGPRGAEITGCVVSPDRKALFVNIQHPGETSDDGGGTHTSSWPAGGPPGSARPRSATVVVRRRDGGFVGM